MSSPQQMPDRMRCAVAAAETGARWWDLAVGAQRAKRGPAVDHADLYGLAAEVVSTLRALEELAGAFARQTESYSEGRRLRDDAGLDPMQRLEQAGVAASRLRADLVVALGQANTFWSAIGHIGLNYDADTATTDRDATDRDSTHGPSVGRRTGPGLSGSGLSGPGAACEGGRS